MSEAPSRDRLQPALLDRLTDTHTGARATGEQGVVMTRSQLRDAVLRDLRWLFNATQPHPAWNEDQPELAGTVLNYGLPPISGQRVSTLDLAQIERSIAASLRRFEPRILPDTLVVRAIEPDSLLDTHNLIEFEIRGHMWAQPVPLEILLRTRLDLEAGQVEVRDGAASTTIRPA